LDFSSRIPGKKKYGIKAFANAILSIPITLYENSGLKVDCLSKCIEMYENYESKLKNYNCDEINHLDSFSVKKTILNTVCIIVIQILLIDEIFFGRGLG
jgi:T-complex protein 1 subunit zeta